MFVGVNISSFRFKKKNDKSEEDIPFYTVFSQFNNKCPYLCKDIIELIQEFYNAKMTPEIIDYYKKYFKTKEDSFKIHEENDRIYVSFTVSGGSYGINSSITDIETNEKIFEKSINNADVKDFRVMFAFAKNFENMLVKKGVVLFQTIGQYGIKTLTISRFRNFLSTNFNIIPYFYSVSTRDAFEKILEQGNLKKINLIKNEVSPEFSNIMGVNCGKAVTTISLTNVKEKKKFIDKIMDMATSGNEIYEIDDKYDDISVIVDIAGRTKTVGIKNLESLSIVEELPSNVLDNDGKINEHNINKAMMRYANDYLDNIVEGDEILV